MRLKVDNCCCVNLRTGSQIIAWCGIVAVGFALAISSIAFVGMFVIMAVQANEHPIMGIQPNDFPASQTARDNFVMQNLVSTTNIIPSLVVNILLILGIKKNNHFMLLPWLISGLLGSGLFALFTVIAIIALIIVEPLAGVVVMIVTVAAFAFGFWLWLIVYSLYQEMNEASLTRVNQMNLQSAYIENGQMVRVPPYETLEKNQTYSK